MIQYLNPAGFFNEAPADLERFPTGWSHSVEKKSLQLQMLEHIPLGLVQSEWNMLKRGPAASSIRAGAPVLQSPDPDNVNQLILKQCCEIRAFDHFNRHANAANNFATAEQRPRWRREESRDGALWTVGKKHPLSLFRSRPWSGSW